MFLKAGKKFLVTNSPQTRLKVIRKYSNGKGPSAIMKKRMVRDLVQKW